MKTICLFLLSLSLLAESYKLPFTWEIKDAPKAKVKKFKIENKENRALASKKDGDTEDVKFWKYENTENAEEEQSESDLE